MKKRILTFSVVMGSAIGALAQVGPDYSFDLPWVATPNPTASQDPKGWASLNALTYVSMPRTVFQETGAGAYQGTGISAKIVTEVIPAGFPIPNPFRPGTNLDTVGTLVIGKAVISVFPPSAGLKYGDSTYSHTRHGQLSFQCKYTPVGNDSAYVLAYLTHWNTTSIPNKRDTIAIGGYATGAIANWEPHSFSMNYKPGFSTTIADSQIVILSSSYYNRDGAKKGSTFWVDAFAWSGFISTNDIDGVENSVTVFPNPATTHITLKCTVKSNAVQVSDVTGRLVGIYEMKNNEVKIQTDKFKNGIYFYSVLNDKKEIISRGKFDITK